MGLKHSGKSSLAARLADERKYGFLDLDDLIELQYRADKLVSCREIYNRHGKSYFTGLETDAAVIMRETLLAHSTVGALGGGTGENAAAMKSIIGAGILVYLHDRESVLFERIMKRGRPAFLPEDNPESAFHELYVRRHELYLGYANVTVEIDGRHIDEAYELLRASLHGHIEGS